MRINDVRVRILEAPITEVIHLSFSSLRVRRMGLVEVEADDGTVGYGETWLNFPPWAGVERRATINKGIAPLLRGERVDNVTRLIRLLHSGLDGFARQAGAKGPLSQAISGVEIALWDLLGKARQAPIYELLGGSHRGTVPLYASGLDPSTVADLGRRCVEEGFQGIKLRVGFDEPDDLAAVDQASALLGDGGHLYLDANQAWSLDEAITLLDKVGRHRVSWVEEPINGNSVDDLERLHQKVGIPVALGENLYGLTDFFAYVRSDAVAALQPDVSKVGGILEMSRICFLADVYRKAVVPHWYGGAVALAATLHVAAAHPAIEQVEFDVRANPFRDSLVTQTLHPKDGTIEVPDGPGLGVEPDPAAISKYEDGDDD